MKVLRANSFKKYTIDDIIEEVCYHYNVTEEEVLSRNRPTHLVEARQMIMYIARKNLYMPYQAIADRLKRNHATVLYAFKKLDFSMTSMEKKVYRRAVNSLSRSDKQVNMWYRQFALLGMGFHQTLTSDFKWGLSQLEKHPRHFNVIYTEI